ncbi:MAG: hypothetical protein MUE49_02590 [Rhodospirillales bacterium]|nr:hypothetical protein [Rhodospirillales bacterium]
MMTKRARSAAPSTPRAGAIVLAVAAALLVVSGCSEVAPFIYVPREFDRRDPQFNKPVTDRTRLTVCYDGLFSSSGDILAFAEAECARFGKTAAPLSAGFGVCPLFTPIEAHFACVADSPPAPDADASPVSGTP